MIGALDSITVWFAQDSLAKRLVDFFQGATVSIDYCCYNSSRSDVVDALIDVSNRGVRVRVITDDSRLDDHWVRQLRSAGIMVWSDSGFAGSSYYMHNKFAIRDLADNDSTNDLVWVASYNPTQGELNADCALMILHTDLANAYLREFNQMWGGEGMLPVRENARFHNRKTDVLSAHRFTFAGYPIYVFFAPQDRVVDTITALVNRAEKEVFFAIYSFTYDPLGEAMVGRWNNGVMIAGVIDKAGANDPASEYPLLRSAHIPILIDSVPFGSRILHEKIMVIDRTIAVTGSANWSNNANYNNDENTLIIYHPGVVKQFYTETLNRYLEAGGDYPPGIAEEAEENPVYFAREGSFFFKMGGLIFDSSGRKVRRGDRVRAGVFFQFDADGRRSRLVVVR